MATAQNVLNFKGPSLRPEFGSKTQVVTKIDVIEDQVSVDQQPGLRKNSKASKRAFLAQTPACACPVGAASIAPTQLAQLLNEAQAGLGEGKPTPSQVLTMLEKVLPQLRDMLPEGPQKTALRHFLNRQSSAKSEGSNDPSKDSENLYGYLTALMLFQVSTAKDQTNISKMNQTLSDSAIKLSQDAETKSESDITTLNNQITSQEKASFWSTLLSGVAIGLGVLVMFFTGSPMLLILAIVGVVTSSVSVNGESLNQHLVDAVTNLATEIATSLSENSTPPTWVVNFFKDVIFGVIAIAEAAVMGGCEGLLEDAVEGTSTAASATTEDVEMVSMNAVEGAEVVGEDASQEAELVSENVAQGTEMASQNLVQDAVDVLKSVLRRSGKAVGRLTNNGKSVGKLLMTLSSTGDFLPTVCQQIAQAVYPDDKDAQMYLAMGLQLGAGLLAAFGGGYLSGTFQGPSLVEKLTSKFGENAVRYTKNSLRLVQVAASAGGSGFDVQTGFILQDEQTTLTDQGNARFSATIAQSMIDSLQTSFSNSAAAFKGVYTGLADMNQSVAERLDPWDPRNYAV